MRIFTSEDLQELTVTRDNWCVSIYMPTIHMSQETRQNPIRFKNLLDQAETALQDSGGLKPPETAALVEPARVLLTDKLFWQRQDKGLAVYLSADFFRHFLLPIEVEEQVVVNERFYLKPILPLLHMENDTFYILALSQNETRFFRASRNEIEQIDLPDLPKSMAEALPDISKERQLQFHTRTSTPGGKGQGYERDAMFHGHGEGEEDKQKNLFNYFRIVNNAVTEYLGPSKAPLVIACVEYVFPIYKQANTYLHLFDDFIAGNYDGVRPVNLHREGWKRIEPIFHTTKEDKVNEYKRLAGQEDQRAVKDVTEIIKAAPFGRVEVLFVDKNAKKWGIFDENNLQVHLDNEPHPENQDLLDYAAVQTLMNGGIVYVVNSEEAPEPGSPAAAIMRY